MQFTGLKDKNGKEIYEGDICKVGDGGEYFGQDWNDDHEPFDTDVFEVYWDSKGALFYIKGLDGKDADLEFSPFGYVTFEVIGSIYENPELLESKS